MPNPKNFTHKLKHFAANLTLVLLALVPFHAFLVVWLSSVFGHGLWFAVWKELLIIVLAVSAAVLVLPSILRLGWRSLLRRPAVVLVGLIILAGLAANILNANYGFSLLVGLKTTALPLVLFIAVQAVASDIDERRLAWVVLSPALVVAGLAIVQFIFVPTEFLTSIGYGSGTILPFQAVHPDFPFSRSFSTLGGPNQLGSYLILPMAFGLALSTKARSRRIRWVASLATVIFAIAAVTSFSRSSLIGLGVAAIVVFLLSVPKRYRLLTAAGVTTAVLVTGLGFWGVLTNDSATIADRFLLRGEITGGGVVGGDEGHIAAIVAGVSAIAASPGGLGFGAAGPASFYALRPIITENWYLQIALEIGVIGLSLMLALLALVMHRVYRRGPQDPLRIGYVAAVCGVLTAALFLHTLADSTLAILIFGVGGILYTTKSPHGATA